MTAIGVVGVTCGGKTTLAQRLVHLIKAQLKTAVCVNQDDFFLPKLDVPRVWKEGDPSVLFYDYDDPKSVNVKRFSEAIDQALIDHEVVIVDGNLITELPSIYEKLAIVLFITLDKNTCYNRRSLRTDYDPPDVPGYFEQIVWPAYQRHLKAAKERADSKCIFVDGTTHPDDTFLHEVIRALNRDMVRIQTGTISVEEITQFVTSPTDGAISIFIGKNNRIFRDFKTRVTLIVCISSTCL